MESVSKYLLIRKILNKLDSQLRKVTVQILQKKLGLTIPWPHKEKQIKEKQAPTFRPENGKKATHRNAFENTLHVGSPPGGPGRLPFAGGAGLRHTGKISDKPGVPSRCLVSQGAFPHTMSASEGKPQSHRTLCWNVANPRTWTAPLAAAFGN